MVPLFLWESGAGFLNDLQEILSYEELLRDRGRILEHIIRHGI